MGSVTNEETGEMTQIPAPKKFEAPQTFSIVCKECGCDHLFPLCQLTFTKSFAMNRMNVTWPHVTPSGNNHGVAACPNCGTIMAVSEQGELRVLPTKWWVKGKEKG